MSFSQDTVNKVWQKATYVSPDAEAKGFRKDQCTAWIQRADYGNRNSAYGWEIDHITTKDDGGGDELSNLRPLQWKNNVSKSDGRLVCVIKSQGNKNVA
jgi:5-methylcytosine-specific restriction endonuclease McrA